MSQHPQFAVGRVIGLAACLGALVGVFVRPVWTDNLIGAQILAGVVSYPADSLMPLIYLRPHSVLTQMAAVLLLGGVPEWWVALASSALQAALGCAALSALTLVFVRHRVAALFVPVLLLKFGEVLPMWPGDYLRVFHGHLYPNTFPVGPGVFGVAGMFVGLLALALIGLDRRRSAALLLGVLPVVHVGMAIPFLGGVGVVAWFHRKTWRGEWTGIARWFGAGALVSCVSIAAYLSYVPTSVPLETSTTAITEALLNQWDDHTMALSVGQWLALLESEVYTLTLAIAMLTVLKPQIDEAARAVVWVVVVITLAGLTYSVIVQWRPDLVPWQVQASLVRRWLNVSSWFFPVAALGLLCRLAFERGRRPAAFVLVVLAAMVWGRVASGITIVSGWHTQAVTNLPWAWLTIPRTIGLVFPIVMVGGALWLWRREPAGGSVTAMPARWQRLAWAAVLVGWLLPFRNAVWYDTAGNGTCSAVIAEARNGNGTLLLGADLWEAEWVQVRTRRPILFEAMDLNILPFTPAAAPWAVDILEQVYGRSLEEGPAVRLDAAWPGLSPSDWQRIAQQFRVTQVLVTDDVALSLPVVARGDGCALFQLPEGM